MEKGNPSKKGKLQVTRVSNDNYAVLKKSKWNEDTSFRLMIILVLETSACILTTYQYGPLESVMKVVLSRNVNYSKFILSQTQYITFLG